MKNTLFILTIVSLVASGCVVTDMGTRTEQSPSSAYASSDEPFPVLNAYGNWFDVGIYGRVWQPAVMSDWRPYTIGQWVWTDRGWMWDSDEPFGWVVYHYGYWTQIGSLGWVWVPGNDWSPARVDWYTSNDYVGWAPMCPPQASYPEAYQTGYENYWTVVPAPQFTRLNVGAYRTTPPPPEVWPHVSHRQGNCHSTSPGHHHDPGCDTRAHPARKTEQDQVRVGRRTVARVRRGAEREACAPCAGLRRAGQPDHPAHRAFTDHDSGRSSHSSAPLGSGRRSSSPRPGADSVTRAHHAHAGTRWDCPSVAHSHRTVASTREGYAGAGARAHHAGTCPFEGRALTCTGARCSGPRTCARRSRARTGRSPRPPPPAKAPEKKKDRSRMTRRDLEV